MIAHERLVELLDYSPETGLFSWRVRTSNRIVVGRACLNKDRHGYVRLRVDGKLYWAARLAWFYVRKVWPQNDIDHINGIRDDNRLCNLREATRSQNLANRRPKHGGYKGVCYVKRTGRWAATVSKDGATVFHKTYATEEEARDAYIAAAKEFHGQYARAS